MKKLELIDEMADKANLPKKVTENLLNAFVDVVTDTLSRGESITLVGFGTFDTTERSAREGRNPQTGEKINIPSSTVARFRAGKLLKERLKQSRVKEEV